MLRYCPNLFLFKQVLERVVQVTGLSCRWFKKEKYLSTVKEFCSFCKILYPPHGHDLPRILVSDKVVGNGH